MQNGQVKFSEKQEFNFKGKNILLFGQKKISRFPTFERFEFDKEML